MMSELLREHMLALTEDLDGHFRRRFPDVPRDSKWRWRTLPGDASHPIIVIESPANPRARMLLKGQLKYQRRWQSMDTEYQVLNEIAPLIAQGNPATRCPEVIAYYRDRQMLLLEMVDGRLLDRIVYGFARPPRGDLRRTLELCGEWLARFHALTASGQEGNPFDWVIERLERPGIRALCERFTQRGVYEQTRMLVKRLRKEHDDLRRPVCTVHGMFAPFHVLVNDDGVYVFDLASCRTGFIYQDLACFLTFADTRFPWRRILGAMRLRFGEQRAAFLKGYFGVAGEPGRADQALLRLARLLAVLEFANHLKAKDTWKRAIDSRVAMPFMRLRVRAAFKEELRALGELAALPRETPA